MASLVQLLPMKLLLVAIFGFLPGFITVYQRGIGNVTTAEWASLALLALGAVLVYGVSEISSSIQMQRYLWPLLAIMGAGLLLFRRSLIARDGFDESTVERGGTSYE